MFILNSDTKISFKALDNLFSAPRPNISQNGSTQPANCFHSKVRTEVSINPPSEEGKTLTEWSEGKTLYSVSHWLTL